MFVFHMIAVDSEFGGRGIGTQLVLRGVEHATRHGFRVLTSETTGITSAKIFQVTKSLRPSGSKFCPKPNLFYLVSLQNFNTLVPRYRAYLVIGSTSLSGQNRPIPRYLFIGSFWPNNEIVATSLLGPFGPITKCTSLSSHLGPITRYLVIGSFEKVAQKIGPIKR